MQPSKSIPCLTANVGRALARLGYADDDRVASALRYCVETWRENGFVGCRLMESYLLNGYCHMLTPKILLFLAEVPQDRWPDGAAGLRDECVSRLREKSVMRSLPAEAREFNELIASVPAKERGGVRERFLAENPTLHYENKPGWLRFGYPLSYNSDALEALGALALTGEPWREEYRAAISAVEDAADDQMRWKLRNSLNGKMIADVEVKGAPSKWLTLRALRVLEHFSANGGAEALRGPGD